MEPSLYERIGHEGFVQLSTKFYDKGFDDTDSAWFLNIFSLYQSGLAIENQYLFDSNLWGSRPLPTKEGVLV
jgi:hypothetical protein